MRATDGAYASRRVHEHNPGPGSHHGDFIDWLTIREQAESVAIDVERIRNHPLVSREIPIYGFVYDVATGRLVEVPGVPRPLVRLAETAQAQSTLARTSRTPPGLRQPISS